jgi:hypothetical protein
MRPARSTTAIVAVLTLSADAAALTTASASAAVSVWNGPEPSSQTFGCGGGGPSTTRRRCADAGNAATTRQTNHHARFINQVARCQLSVAGDTAGNGQLFSIFQI